MTERFEAYCRRKETAARAAQIPGYITVEQRATGLIGFGTEWSRTLFDGEFYRSPAPPVEDVPVISLVFVQSREGNTVAQDPSTLGGGETDLHLVYEGLSRVDADAVMAGASTARSRELVFSIWLPDLISLRLSRGRSRHPAQVVLTERGDLRFDDALLYQEPELRVFIIARSRVVDSIRRRVDARPWIEVLDAGDPVSLTRGMRMLRERGIEVVSCVGGPLTATALLEANLIADVYLTTSAITAGVPGTPYYDGPELPLSRVLLKEGRGVETGVRFEHFVVGKRPETATQSHFDV
jgi:riboflavin biosynthesis pyrimidine reductase